MLNEDFSTFVRLCEEKNVEYMMIGGYAVAIHGYPRYTGNIDVWYRQTETNCIRLVKVVDEFGFGSNNLSVSDLMELDVIIHMGHPPRRIDLVSTIDAVEFNEAYPRTMIYKIADINVKIISKDDLIKNKTASGRHRDLDDVENLS